jgi:uncharacterized membrane protein
VTFANPLPWWAMVALLAAIGAVAWRAAWLAGRAASPPAPVWQRGVLVGLRVLVLLALLAIVMRPVRFVPDPGAQGAVAVLVDVSRSMALADAGGRTRLDAARALVQDRLLPAVAPAFAADIISFGDDARSVQPDDLGSLSATGSATDVSRALESLRRRAATRPLRAVFVVSDGGFVIPDDLALSATEVPVYTLGVGADVVGQDREVRQVTAGESNVAGATIDLTATVVSSGWGTEPVEVRLSGSGRPLEVRRVTPAGDGVPMDVVFRVAPDAATATLFTVEAVAGAGELTLENNRRSVLVPPPGRARRVLLLEGAPGHEHSFLKRALDQDDALEVDAVVRKGANDAGRETFYVQAAKTRGPLLTTGFPETRHGLFAYDVVVLANMAPDVLTQDQLAQIGEYVGERGGGLLVLGARSFQPEAVAGTLLEELLPVEVSHRSAQALPGTGLPPQSLGRVEVTPDGESHPVMRLGATRSETRDRWAALPPLPSFAAVGDPRPGATLLAFAGGPGGVARALVAVQRYGRGRVLAFAGEAAWRWRMMLPSSDTTYPTFWRQATRWLAASSPEPVSVRTRSAGAGGLEVLVEARDADFQPVRDAEVVVQIHGADGAVQTVRPVVDRHADGRYRAEVHVPTGVTRLEVEASSRGLALGRATGWALAGPDGSELIEPRRNDAQLTRLAQAFGGELADPDDLSRIVDGIGARGPADAPLRERDAWHAPWILGLLTGLLAAEWVLRRKWGLR